jgi:DNA invertase Pin-like site-specific DNA recombinase
MDFYTTTNYNRCISIQVVGMLCYSYARVSSKSQIEKSGISRQTKLARQWAESQGYQLTELSDEGLSAYKGHHTSKGNLGRFIKSVTDGNIPKDSILIVESLDRLSREDISTQLAQFLTIISNGIEIVTLADGNRFSKTSIDTNWTELVISIAMMAKANEESNLKSLRISAAREDKHDKRKLNPSLIITQQIPFWCTIIEGKIVPNNFENIIKKIFTLASEGLGSIAIARHLNESNVECYRAKQTSNHDWNSQKVARILRNSAVYGLFTTANKYDDIDNYYPQIITKDIFFTVQRLIDLRNKNKTRSSKGPSNLFSGLLKCKCGASYSYGTSITGVSENSARFLRCNRRTGGEICDGQRYWYFPFEQLILKSIIELTYQKSTINVDPLLSVKGELSQLESQNDNLVNLMLDGVGSEKMKSKSIEIEGKIEKLRFEIFLYKHNSSLKPKLLYKKSDIEEIQDLTNKELRIKIQTQISTVIDRIVINIDSFDIHLTNKSIYRLKTKVKNSSDLLIKDQLV